MYDFIWQVILLYGPQQIQRTPNSQRGSMSTKFTNSPHSLSYSPTTLAFDQQFSNEKLEQVPALVSINQKAAQSTPQSTIAKRTSPLNGNKRKDFKNLNSPKNKAVNSNSKKMHKNSIPNANKYLFNVGAKRKTNSSPLINKNNIEQQPSLTESVGLDLEEYSSIHKLEHASPYFSQDLEEEDQQYAAYLMKEEENERVFLNWGVPQLFLDSESNQLKKPALDSKDTYNQFLDNDLTFQPQFKVKRIQSTGAEPLSSNFKTHFNLDKPAMSQKQRIAHQEFNTQSHEIPRIEEEQSEYKKSSKKTSTANIHYFHTEPKDEFFSISKDMLQRFFKKELIEIDEDERFLMKAQIGSKVDEQETQKNEQLNLLRNVFTTEPEWIRSKSSANLLRLILTKGNRLLQYLKYLTELQILLKKKQEKDQLDRICDRSDTVQMSQKEEQSVVKVYFDKEAKLTESVQESSPRKYMQRYDSPRKWIANEKKNKPFSEVCSAIGENPSPEHIKNERLIQNKLVDRAEGRMKKQQSKSPTKSPKQNETKSNDLELKRQRQQHSPISLYSINSQIDIRSTFSHNQIDSNGKANASRVTNPIQQIEAVKLLKLLLVKLENKKCNLYVKHGRENQVDNRSASPNSRFSQILEEEEEDLESISRRGTQRNQKQTEILQYKSSQKESIQISKIEFEEYLQSASKGPHSKQQQLSGNRLITYSQRIKQLNEQLESKDKYIYEIKSNYDYIINNYIKSISNLSRKKGVKWDQDEPLSWKQGMYTSISSSPENNQRSFKNVNGLQDNLQSEDSLISKEGRKQSSFENNGHNKNNKSLQRSVESQLENQRLSQPMTFKMSRKGINDSREEDQWIGNPLALSKQGNGFRYSSPEKQ